jgi:hypothetical protein
VRKIRHVYKATQLPINREKTCHKKLHAHDRY